MSAGDEAKEHQTNLGVDVTPALKPPRLLLLESVNTIGGNGCDHGVSRQLPVVQQGCRGLPCVARKGLGLLWIVEIEAAIQARTVERRRAREFMTRSHRRDALEAKGS